MSVNAALQKVTKFTKFLERITLYKSLQVAAT